MATIASVETTIATATIIRLKVNRTRGIYMVGHLSQVVDT